MARKVDIDQKLAAKGQLDKEPVEVTFRGRDWTFAPDLALEVGDAITDGRIMDALLLILDESQHADFRKLGITVQEANVLLSSLAEAYGVVVGESEASK